ncbi:MAG: ATP-dependent dethiobiotin synthetase BioD [Bacteroidales bacterium]|nr:ATP-dependent dethiobiotin synthetase BioD [Bacteroidales bacterium]
MNLCSSRWPEVVFVTGIGTDVGKSYATGWLARVLSSETGKRVITQKFIQTGNKDFSEDIAVHRRLMGIPMQTVDRLHITAPIIFSYPASPDLASRLDGRELDLHIVDEATSTLQKEYDFVLVEGAGGIMVPLKDDYLTIDYIIDRKLPTVVVTNGQLGSVSDTLLTLSAIREAGIALAAVVYNPYFDKDKTISDDSREYLRRWTMERFPDAMFIEMPQSL